MQASGAGSDLRFDGMSFDLYFVERRPGEQWHDVMTRIEEAAGGDRTLDDDDAAAWDRIVGEVSPILDGITIHRNGGSFELDHEATGLQLSMFPSEIALSVPYWYDGDEAVSVERLLRDVAAAVERATGLTAYDPQADAAFLATEPGAAADTFDHVSERMAELGVERSPTRVPWWRRLFGRS